MYEMNMPVPQGWQCPVCGRVYAPFLSMCYYCGREDRTVVTNMTAGTEPSGFVYKTMIGSECDDRPQQGT